MGKKHKKRKADEGYILNPHIIFRGPPTDDKLAYMSEYDTLNDEPYQYVGELPEGVTPLDLMEKRRIQKVKKEDRGYLFAIWKEFVTDYWNRKHLIPQDKDFKGLKRQTIEYFANECRYALKEDSSLNSMLQQSMISTINKLLKV